MYQLVSKTLTIILLTVFMVQLEGCAGAVPPCVSHQEISGSFGPPDRGACNNCWDNVFNKNGNFVGAKSKNNCGSTPITPCKDPVYTALCNACKNTPDAVGNISCN